jgi:predicted RNase H-like nuclease (RuvC/YqgF family)
MQASKQQCKQLAKELETSRTQVDSLKAELEQVKSFTREAHGECIYSADL